MTGPRENVSGVLVAIETSARAASAAIRAGGRDHSARLDRERAHAADLLPALERLLREAGAEPRGIGAVLVGTGPGSYTGLRVGIATALGLARGTGAALRGVPSGETLVFGEVPPGEEAVVLLDARQGQVYLAHHRRTAEGVEVLRAPCVLEASEVAAVLPGGVTILGDDTVADAAGLTEEQRARLRCDAVPQASALLGLGARELERLGPQRPGEIEPLYLRAFGARASASQQPRTPSASPIRGRKPSA